MYINLYLLAIYSVQSKDCLSGGVFKYTEQNQVYRLSHVVYFVSMFPNLFKLVSNDGNLVKISNTINRP